MFGALVAAGVMLVALYFSKSQRINRALRKAPRVNIAQASDGDYVKLVGTLEPIDQLAAPLSGRACSYYEVIVEEERGARNRTWSTVIRERDGCPFMINDGTAKARVELSEAETALTQDGHWSSGFLNDADPELEAYLARHGKSSTGLVFNRTLRYREGVLEPGEQVAVLGVIGREVDPDGQSAGFREAPSRVNVSGEPNRPMRVSDDPSTLGEH